ncbi:MAG: phosphoadenylyl-sulfate reductase [Proteobacteria bacterium]|nr:phosphoadenylyl-sulfate reductase [Pseudomonadota bacterium]
MSKLTIGYGNYLIENERCDPLRAVIRTEFSGRILLVSSFGAEAAVLLHRVARINPDVPVIFVDTGKIFGETLRYRDELTAMLGLTDVRSVQPLPEAENREDPDGTLWMSRADACCYFRKVEPLERALQGADAWISGRKRHHGGARATLPWRETAAGRTKINAMADWNPAMIQAYCAAHDLPPHPLVADGFASIGCMPCTTRVSPQGDARSGRWSGSRKTECGIHLPLLSVA